MAEISELYDQDFLLWCEEQAAALRRAKGANLPLDWDNLAEEIESLGKSERRELSSQVRRILRHLFKLDASSADRPRAGWQTSIILARADLGKVLRDSPSLRRELEELIAEETAVAARAASGDLSRYGEATEAIRRRLAAGGFTAEQVLGDWFPEPRSNC